jgi:hypothetical protein
MWDALDSVIQRAGPFLKEVSVASAKCVRNTGYLALTLILLLLAPLASADHVTDGIFSPNEWTGPTVNKTFFAPAPDGSGNAFLYVDQGASTLYLAYDFVGGTTPLTGGSFVDVFFQVPSEQEDYAVRIHSNNTFEVFVKPFGPPSAIAPNGSFDLTQPPWSPATAADLQLAKFQGAIGFVTTPNLSRAPSLPHVFIEFQLNINNSLAGRMPPTPGLYDPSPAFWSAGVLSLPGASPTHDPPITSAIFTVNPDLTTIVTPVLGVNGGPVQQIVETPLLAKSFGAPAIPVNGSTSLTFTITNLNTTVALTGISFSDNLPLALVIATPNGLTGSCGGGTITAVAGTNLISLMGATLAPTASCTFSVNVTGISPGLQTNTTSAVTSTNGGTNLTATASITVLPIITDGSTGVYELRYLANLNQGDSFVNFTNAGTLSGFDPAGRICVNVYTFDPAEEMISCCACPVTPNGLNSLSARNDLISNTLTPGVPTSITVKLLSSLPLPGNTCNAASPNAANLVRGMRAWATTLHLNTAVLPAPGVYQHTETPFSVAELSTSELTKLTSFCAFIQSNGSGFGICKACRTGALGAEIK